LQDKVKFVFGLACGMYQNVFYTDLLLAESGINEDEVASISYRVKTDIGPANNYGFQAIDINGKTGKLIPYKGLPYFLGKHAFFRQNACNFCMDVFAEGADACFMDAWLPEFLNQPKGNSLVILRNTEIRDLLLQGQLGNKLAINEICPELVILSQKGHVRRKRELISLRRVSGSSDARYEKPTMAEHISWQLQRHTQARSKKAWASYGRNCGRIAFWLALYDVLLLQMVAKHVGNIFSLPPRLVGKLKKALSRPSVKKGCE
jgi:coenzyme F420-reducing hydrogenase beta subunit